MPSTSSVPDAPYPVSPIHSPVHTADALYPASPMHSPVQTAPYSASPMHSSMPISASLASPTPSSHTSISLCDLPDIDSNDIIPQCHVVIQKSVPSTSDGIGITAIESNSSPISNWEYSPFKKHLKISESLIIARKYPKSKSKVPSAISGTEYIQHAQKLQDEKQKKLELQEDRKRKRLMKKDKEIIKGKSRKKQRPSAASETESEQEVEMVFDDSEEEETFEEEEGCFACLGRDLWSDHKAWLGCSNRKCMKWFHKKCISAEVLNMTREEIEKYEFYCRACEKKLKK